METRKLGQTVTAQRTVTRQIEVVAADFLEFYQPLLPSSESGMPVQIAVGTERGFCGNLNQRLLAGCRDDSGVASRDGGLLLAVGRKLHMLVADGLPPFTDVTLIDGAGVAEEVTAVLQRLMDALDVLQERHGALALSSLYIDSRDMIVKRQLLPPFEQLQKPSDHAHSPLLNLTPAALLVELSDQYLISVLHEIFYDALLQENLRRVSRLTAATKHLDDRITDLAHKAKALRQEEIVEEIEVILLSASSLDEIDNHGT